MQTNIEASAGRFMQASLHTIYYSPFCLHLTLLVKYPLIIKRFRSVDSIKNYLHCDTTPALVCTLLAPHLHTSLYYHTIAPQPLRPPVNDKRALTSPKTTCHNPLKYRYVPLFPPCASNRLCRRQCRQKSALPTLRNSMVFNLLHPKSVRCRQEPKKQYGNIVPIC